MADSLEKTVTHKVVGAAAAFLTVALLTASGATYAKARDNAATHKAEKKLSTNRDALLEHHRERLEFLEGNQRLIICQIKSETDMPCNPMDLLKVKGQ